MKIIGIPCNHPRDGCDDHDEPSRKRRVRVTMQFGGENYYRFCMWHNRKIIIRELFSLGDAQFVIKWLIIYPQVLFVCQSGRQPSLQIGLRVAVNHLRCSAAAASPSARAPVHWSCLPGRRPARTAPALAAPANPCRLEGVVVDHPCPGADGEWEKNIN